jgi:hypothetical protein
MNLQKRINAFSRLGEKIESISTSEFEELCEVAVRENPWFTSDNIRLALTGVRKFLFESALQHWTSGYQLKPDHPKTIGVAMAGNIPLVGFHDFLCVLISGHSLKAKLSAQDSSLVRKLAEYLTESEPGFDELIHFEERLNNVDGVIATGSNNTARYFEYYFRNIPHIIRKNRSSCAVISGEESTISLTELGLDVFSYFGLGCRNVSKLYVPETYDFASLLASWKNYKSIIHHHKYVNNYDYQKSIMLVNKIPFLDNEFVLLKEDTSFVSPISVLFYEYYTGKKDLEKRISGQHKNIQCIVSAGGWFNRSEDFGQAQYPQVFNYADNVDTLRFLEAL